MGMAEILQKVSRSEKSICPKCFHNHVCLAIDNQPCFECNQFVEVVRCKDCKHYMAEEKERCEAMKATPYGLCIKHRGLPLASYHEYRNEDGFCSYGERKDHETG